LELKEKEDGDYHGDGPGDENQNNSSIGFGSNIVVTWYSLKHNLWKECNKL